MASAPTTTPRTVASPSAYDHHWAPAMLAMSAPG
jgi:hypothetical protein